MKLLTKLKDFIGRVTGDPAKEFFAAFELTAKTRGCVAYFQTANETNINGAGLNETVPTEGVTTKLVLLPGDPYPGVTKNNLVAFEGLNRTTRRSLLKIRYRVA